MKILVTVNELNIRVFLIKVNVFYKLLHGVFSRIFPGKEQ